MKDVLGVNAIASAAMQVERRRIDAVALNLANVNSTRDGTGQLYRPMNIISGSSHFERLLEGAPENAGPEILEVYTEDAAPRLVYDPSHPQANADGMVAYPAIDPLAQMVRMMASVRVYEANIAVLNASKAMALRTLEIGGK